MRTARREPWAIEHSYFPVDTFPDLLTQRLTGSLYDLLSRRYGQIPVSAAESLQPVTDREREAALLKVEVGSPLMLIERTAYTSAGLAVEFARDLFRPGPDQDLAAYRPRPASATAARLRIRTS